MGKYQSSGRERRMVQYREKKDWASYQLTRIYPSSNKVVLFIVYISLFVE